MGSSQKVFTLSLCLLLSSAGIIEAFGMFNNHRRNKGLEALLASGIIALLLRNHQLSKYASGGHGHGHGLQGINFGHGKGHVSNVGSLTHADNLKLLGNIHTVPGLSQAHNFHGIGHLSELHGLPENIAGIGHLSEFHGLSKNIAGIGHLPEFHGLPENIAGIGHLPGFHGLSKNKASIEHLPEFHGLSENIAGILNLPEFHGFSKNIPSIGHLPEFNGLSENIADIGHLTEFHGLHENIDDLGNFKTFPDIKKYLSSVAGGHGKNIKCVGQGKKLKVSGHDKLFPINLLAQKLAESAGDVSHFKAFENSAGLENVMQNNNLEVLKHKNNFGSFIPEANSDSHDSNSNLADKLSFVGLKHNYNEENNGNGKSPTMRSQQRSYSYEAYEHPETQEVGHTLNYEEDR